MRSIALVLLFSLSLLKADFYPATIQCSVASVQGNSVTLTKGLSSSGMSAVVIHNYGSELKAITSYITYNGGNKATLTNFEPLVHDTLPAIKPNIKQGDQVIGGYLYNNILVLAPDADTYAKITASASKNWVHPDLYAMFLSREGDAVPTKKNLAKFASEYQVGLIYIVQSGKAVLYDPASQHFVSQKSLSGLPAVGQAPFFMRLGQIDTGWFSQKTPVNYYQIMSSIK